MKCDQCGKEMVNVGRQIKTDDPKIWVDGYVCPKKDCLGYATHEQGGNTVRWPALTLADQPVHAYIYGAKRFRDARIR